MTIREIPRSFEYECDICGAAVQKAINSVQAKPV